ncbi:MAG: GTPase ObgE [Planctomycetes bacterium]|nr:GTPase ObgE [Planctomycetota bacterium]
MFRDEVEIELRAGDGGRGCVSFRREKFVPRGGPDGGDGGDGGDVILACDPSVNTLYDLASTPKLSAEPGRPGEGKNCHGRRGKDLVLRVAVGTVVFDTASGRQVADLAEIGQKVVIVRGGKGGRGNKFFATATHQVPREAEDGQQGERLRLRLELKLIADVGLVGLPNAGKSTLLARISAARPKIADYPFTTLEPHLGIVRVGEYERLVFADIPGLIEGAHDGHGLGDKFLRHIERTRVLVHLVDASPHGVLPPDQAYRTVRNELAEYSEGLASKPEVVVANQVDIPGAEGGILRLAAEAGREPVRLSGFRGDGIPDLLKAVLAALHAASPGFDDSPGRC